LENMPGPNKAVYATATLSICIFTTIVCGGLTERMLTVFEMKEEPTPIHPGGDEDDDWSLNALTFTPTQPRQRESAMDQHGKRLREGIRGVWHQLDDQVLKPHFGGEGVAPSPTAQRSRNNDHLGDYELSSIWANGSGASDESEGSEDDDENP
jgi:hypothetical protein